MEAVVYIIHMNKIYLDNPGKKHLYQVICSTIKNSTNFCTNSPSCQWNQFGKVRVLNKKWMAINFVYKLNLISWLLLDCWRNIFQFSRKTLIGMNRLGYDLTTLLKLNREVDLKPIYLSQVMGHAMTHVRNNVIKIFNCIS